MEEIKNVRISDLIPADYNPRKLSDSSFAMLKKSLEELGQVKPIIVNGANNIIMAGHQRTRAMTALGWTECDAFVLQGVNDQDEARFNQLHNKTEYEVSKNAPTVIIKSELKFGVNEVEPKDIVVKDKGKMAVINKLLSTLIQRYGTFGMPIATPDGVVHISSAYAMASKLCRRKMPVLVMDEERVALAVSYFSKEYGVFCYDTIARKTYIQSLAQIDLSVHCARCLIGQYSRIFPFRGRVTEMYNEPLEEHSAKWLYLCGVSNRYENNLHIAFEEADGETLLYDDGKTIVEIEGARQIPIVQLDSYPLEEKGNLKEYNTCRNWRFAYQMTHGTK